MWPARVWGNHISTTLDRITLQFVWAFEDHEIEDLRVVFFIPTIPRIPTFDKDALETKTSHDFRCAKIQRWCPTFSTLDISELKILNLLHQSGERFWDKRSNVTSASNSASLTVTTTVERRVHLKPRKVNKAHRSKRFLPSTSLIHVTPKDSPFWLHG